ncbi:MAG: hypothetical protein U0570_04325 [Phycisphaerales bacterium]
MLHRRYVKQAAALAALLLGAVASSSIADTLTWTGAGDGVEFSQPANWSPSVAPGPAHDCIIDSGSGTIRATGVFNLRSIESSRDLWVSGCSTVTLTAGLTLHAGAKFTIIGNCTGLVLTGGAQTIDGDGQIEILTNTALPAVDIVNNAQVTIAPGVTMIYGVAATGTTASVSVGAGASLRNQGVIYARKAGTFTLKGAGQLINQGTLLSEFSVLKVAVPNWSSSGHITANRGTIQLDNTWVSTGAINATDSSALTLSGNWTSSGPVTVDHSTLTHTGTWTNAGTISLTHATWAASGSTTSLGNFARDDASVIRISARLSTPLLEATVQTGQLILESATLVGTTLHHVSGPGFSSSSCLFDGCTVGNDLAVSGLTVSNGLTLTNGARLAVSNENAGLVFTGAPQTVGGDGSIFLDGSTIGISSDVTLLPGVTLDIGTSTRGATISIGMGVNFTLQSPISLPANSKLTITGAGYFVNQSAIQASGATLNITPGSWTNSGAINLTDSTLTVSGSWSNPGSISLTNSIWNVGGTYASLGSFTRSGGAINFGGTFTGTSFIANAATGDILLQNITLQGATISAADGARFLLAGTVTLRDCTLASDLDVPPCALLKIDHDLALSGASLTVRNSASCTNAGLQFLGGTQSVSGSGSIILNPAGYTGSATAMQLLPGTRLTIGPGVSLVRGSDGLTFVDVGPSSSLSIQGPLSLASGLTFSGGPVTCSGSITLAPAFIELTFANLTGSVGPVSLGASSKLVATGIFTLAQPVSLAENTRLTVQGTSTFAAPLSLASGSTLTVTGSCTVNADLVAVQSTISFSGAWSNTANMHITGGKLTFAGTWSNSGLFDVSGANWTIGGSYPALGNSSGAANSFTFRDSFPGSLLLADASTGNVTLESISLAGVTLRSRDGAKLLARSANTFTACPLDGTLAFTQCATATFTSGLVLAPGSRIEIDSAACSNAALRFVGGTQSISGSGEIVAVQADVLRLQENVALTIGPDILIRTESGSGISSLVVDSGSLLTNLGVLSSRVAGRTLRVTGPFTNLGVCESLAGTFSATGGPVLNQGQIRALGASVSISALQGNLGQAQVVAPGSLTVSGTNFTIDQPISVSAGAKLSLAGTYSVAALLQSTGGELALSGTCTINHDLSVNDGKLTLDGSWTNNKTILVRNGALTLSGAWSNAGTIDIASSNWSIGGTYSSLGAVISSNNALTYTGAYPGTFLRADASTGDITLSGAVFSNATLQCADGARFLTAQKSTAATLNACTIDGEFVVGNCAGITVTGGLTLLHGSRVIINNPSCTGAILFGATAAQSVLGDGEIVLKGVGASAPIQSTAANLTFAPGITIRYPADAQGHVATTISISPGKTLTLAGTLSAERPGSTLTIGGSGLLTNSGTIRVTAGTLALSSSISNISSPAPPPSQRTLTGGKWHALGGKLTGVSAVQVIGPATEVMVQGGSANGFPGIRENRGTLKISGSWAPSSFTNRGNLELGADTTFTTGSLIFDSTSVLTLVVQGNTPGNFPAIQTSPATAQGGALRVRFQSPYFPQPGDLIGPVLTTTTFYDNFNSVCTDANPFNLGVSPQLDVGPSRLSFLVTPDSGYAPIFLASPQSTSATANASFSAQIAPANATIQWKHNSAIVVDGPTGSGSTISGAATPTLTILNAQPSDVGDYTITLANSCGTLTSNPATLRLCTGDLNADALVDDADFVLFLASYNILDCADPSMPPLCPGDLNADNLVDDTDFTIFVAAYNELLCP